MTANKRERSVTAQLSGKDQSMGRMENEIIVKMLQDRQGDQQQLLEMLWKQNVSLVRKIIQESTGIERWNQDFEDLEQQAFLGILESISRYDFSQGNRFFTYATHYIVKSLRKYYDRYCQSLRIPPAMRAKIKSYMRAREELQASGQVTTDKALMESLGMSEQEFRNVSDSIQKVGLVSLDSRREENDKDSGTLLDMVSDPSQNTESASDSVYLQELHNTLTAALGTLSIRECEIIYARFYKGQTLEEIGDTLHCSKGNIDCHIQNAFRKLRRGKYGKELASFLPDQQERRAIRNINRESERKTAGLSEQEKDLLL